MLFSSPRNTICNTGYTAFWIFYITYTAFKTKGSYCVYYFVTCIFHWTYIMKIFPWQYILILQHRIEYQASGHMIFTSVQFSHSVVSDSLWPHEPQHTRPPCPSPTPRVYSDSCPSSRWCHPAISSSVVPFSSCPQSLPASGSLPMSQLFTWGGQIIGVSASTSVLPMNTQDWSALGWTGWISLQSKGLSRFFSNTTVQKYQFSGTQVSL